MKEYSIETLLKRYPELEVCKKDINEAYEILKECFANGHKLLIAGNGGSSADADHIVGELMKSFKNNRAINKELANKIRQIDKNNGDMLAKSLQKGLPAIALHNHPGLNTALINDVENGGLYIYAQQLLNYGQDGDVLLCISTSGNAQNVYNAAVVAKAKGIKVIGLTGQDGGKLAGIADMTIKAPSNEVYIIQEYHLPIYHYLCLMLENYFFNK